MEPRPDKEDPDSSPSDRDSGDFAPKERNVGAGGDMEDGEELVPDEVGNPGEEPEDEDYVPLDEDLEDDPEDAVRSHRRPVFRSGGTDRIDHRRTGGGRSFHRGDVDGSAPQPGRV